MKQAGFKRSLPEFGLIVLGVLVALAADGYVDGRGDAQVANQYIASLIGDLRGDTALARVTLSGSDLKEESLLELRAILGRDGEDSDAARVAVALVWASSTWRPVFNDATYTDLVASGNLGLLGYDGRRLIAKLYRRYAADEREWSNVSHPMADMAWYVPASLLDRIMRCFLRGCAGVPGGHSADLEDLTKMVREALTASPSPDTTVLMRWQDAPDLGLRIQGELQAVITTRQRFDLGTLSSILLTLDSLEAFGPSR